MTAPSVSSPHAALVAALQADDPEPAIEQAHRQLTTRGGDLPLLLAMAAALVRAGLGGVAQRLLESVGAPVQEHASVRQILDHIARVPSGQLAPSLLIDRFAANREMVLSRLPHLRSLLAAAALPPDICIYRSHAGNDHALRESPLSRGRMQTVFPFIDFRGNVAAMRLPPFDLSTSFLMIGMPSPQTLARLMRESVGGYRPPIDIIEADADIFIVWLHLLDDPAILRDPRVGLFIGASAADEYRDFILKSSGRTPATLILTNHRPGWQPPAINSRTMSVIGEQMRERQRRLRSSLEQRFDGRDAAFWRTRFAMAQRDGAPLRIVGFTNRYSTVIQHAMRDFASAFARQGHEFEIIAQPDDCSAAIDVAGALAKGADHGRACDMIVAINHLRFEYPDSMPRNVPFVGWIQDHLDHLWKRDAGESIGELDLVIAHAPHVLASLYGYPTDRVLASSNLTDPHVYSDEPMPDDELAPHRCDLSFVSHGAATPETLVDELGAATTPAFHRLLERFLQIAREQLQANGCANAARLVELMLLAEKQAGGPPLPSHVRRAHVYPQIAKIHDRLFRHQTLQWAANWARSRKRTLRIYGRGWDKHSALAEFACGEIDSGRPRRAVYQASSVNLQANAYASLHQRLLDGLASGTCMIARHNPADFVRGPFTRIAQTITSHGLRTLDELMALRTRDVKFAAVCDEAERLSSAVIALSSDPRRIEHMRIQREGNDIAELQSDEGLFAALRDMRFMPARVAADLPGFEQIVFRDEGQMYALLDRLVDDEDLRCSIARPMREAVLVQDTYDALVDRIIDAFARGSAA